MWVVDAQSTDGSVEALGVDGKGSRDAVHIMRVANNGFAAGNNRGIAAGSAPFVLLLNPDATLGPGALEALLATAEAWPQAAIVGALIRGPAGGVQSGSFGRFPSLPAVAGLHLWRLAQRLRRNTQLSPKAPRRTAPVDWVTGAAMLVRRAAITEVGGLDEGFFLYYEDIDWCRRMRAGGWEILLEPAAKVVHHLGGSEGPRAAISEAYRTSFFRYCDLYGLWGLKAVSRAGLALRRLLRRH